MAFCWKGPYKRGGLWWEGPYKRDTTVEVILTIGILKLWAKTSFQIICFHFFVYFNKYVQPTAIQPMLTILSLKPISLYNYHIHKNIFYILKKSNFIQLFTSFYYKAPNVIDSSKFPIINTNILKFIYKFVFRARCCCNKKKKKKSWSVMSISLNHD